MFRKYLSSCIYFIYNFLNKNYLNALSKQVAAANNTIDTNETEKKVDEYLKKWKYKNNIKEIPLSGRTEIINSTKESDKSKIKSWAYTGGSYGEPLRIPYSKKRNLIRTATFKHFNEKGGYHLGDPFVLIRAKDKSRILKFLRNETIFIPGDISDARIKLFIEKLKRKKIKVLMGYPTVVYEIALFLMHHPEQKEGIGIKSIITVSETLEDYKRQLIYDVFQCSFIDRYSNEEVGLIAQQREYGGEYFVNRFGVYTEIIDPETLQPVQEGEQGKVVVTDIYNDLIPVVRYDTGDLGTVNKYENGQLISIRNIVGRVNEQIITVDGNPVSPLALGPFIYKPLARQGEVFQYQFAQLTANQYELRIKAREGQLSEQLVTEITSGLETALGKGSFVALKILDDIKPLPSGKRPIFKNEMSKKTI